MPRTEYSKDERSHALDLYREHGPRKAGRLTGIPVRTICWWATEGDGGGFLGPKAFQRRPVVAGSGVLVLGFLKLEN